MKHRIFGIENEFGILTDNENYKYGVEIGNELLQIIRNESLFLKNIDPSFLRQISDLTPFKNKDLSFSNGGFTSLMSNGGRAYIDGSHFEM